MKTLLFLDINNASSSGGTISASQQKSCDTDAKKREKYNKSSNDSKKVSKSDHHKQKTDHNHKRHQSICAGYETFEI